MRAGIAAQCPVRRGDAPRLLHGLARQLLQQQRIPFEADPLGGVQVLGMLESRLLQFDRIFIVDATDDVLPGAPGQDPLLPDSLRRILGLPDARRRERAASHTLYRLCACAREVHFYWQESQGRSGLMDSKKARSRFVEQLIWAHEQRTGALLTPGTAPLAVAACDVTPMPPRALSLKRNQALQDAMRDFLAAPIPPTALDTYLHCPLAFVWKHLCRFRPVQEVNEKDDPRKWAPCCTTCCSSSTVPTATRRWTPPASARKTCAPNCSARRSATGCGPCCRPTA